jgi:hypothetical protein
LQTPNGSISEQHPKFDVDLEVFDKMNNLSLNALTGEMETYLEERSKGSSASLNLHIADHRLPPTPSPPWGRMTLDTFRVMPEEMTSEQAYLEYRKGDNVDDDKTEMGDCSSDPDSDDEGRSPSPEVSELRFDDSEQVDVEEEGEEGDWVVMEGPVTLQEGGRWAQVWLLMTDLGLEICESEVTVLQFASSLL